MKLMRSRPSDDPALERAPDRNRPTKRTTSERLDRARSLDRRQDQDRRVRRANHDRVHVLNPNPSQNRNQNPSLCRDRDPSQALDRNRDHDHEIDALAAAAARTDGAEPTDVDVIRPRTPNRVHVRDLDQDPDRDVREDTVGIDIAVAARPIRAVDRRRRTIDDSIRVHVVC